MAEKKPTDDMNKRLSFKDFMTVEYKPGEDELVNYRAYRRKRTDESIGAAAAGGAMAAKMHVDKSRDDEERRRKEPDSEAPKKAKSTKPEKKQNVTYRINPRYIEMRKKEKAKKAAAEKLANRPVHQKAMDAVKGGLGKMFGKKKKISWDHRDHDTKESTVPTTTEYSLEDILEVISRGERMRRKRATKFGPLKHKLKRGRLKAKRRFATKDVLSNRSRKGSRKAIEKKFTKGIPKSKLSIAQKQSLERKLERPAIQKRIALAQRRLMPKKRRQEIARKQGSWKK